jgi:hypothetical protein
VVFICGKSMDSTFLGKRGPNNGVLNNAPQKRPRRATRNLSNARRNAAKINAARVNAALNTRKTSIAKAMFADGGKWGELHKNDTEEVTDELINSENDASKLMIRILNPQDQRKFMKAWKGFVSQQITNGSFLEFQGMRFMDEGTLVYDVERYNVDEGLAVFQHILEPPPPGKAKVYLKCKFKLNRVNTDTSRIIPQLPVTWADLYHQKLAKGLVDCEPDVIIRTSNEIRIFEMKMGQGKKDTASKATEANQLARCKHLFEFWLNASENTNLQPDNIKLYFVGWSASTNTDVEFTPAPWSVRGYQVTAVNGAGMRNYAPINPEIVTRIITMLNIIKLEQFYRAAGMFMKRWSAYYPQWQQFKAEQLAHIKANAPKFGNAFNKPPAIAISKPKTKAQNLASRNTEMKLRGNAQLIRHKAVNGVASNSNSNNENAQVRRFNWVWKHTPAVTQQQRLIEYLTGNQLRALADVANARKAQGNQPINTRLLGLVSKKASNWDVTYQTFLKDHANIPNARSKIQALLSKPPPGLENNYRNKLAKKAAINAPRGRPALGAF